MNIATKSKMVFFLITILLLSGCASTGTMQLTKPVSERINNYNKIAIDVSSDIKDSSSEVIQLEKMVVIKLREKGLFERVIPGTMDTSTDLHLKIKIVELQKVGSAARLVFGALAGQAKVTVDAKLVDIKTNSVLGAFRAEGKSSGGSTFAGTTEQALERVAEQIVAFLIKSRPETVRKSSHIKIEEKTKPSENKKQPEHIESKTAERLKKLRALYEEGLITEKEYQEKRSEILQGL